MDVAQERTRVAEEAASEWRLHDGLHTIPLPFLTNSESSYLRGVLDGGSRRSPAEAHFHLRSHQGECEWSPFDPKSEPQAERGLHQL